MIQFILGVFVGAILVASFFAWLGTRCGKRDYPSWLPPVKEGKVKK